MLEHMTSETMGDPVTQGQFFERMQLSDERRDEQHGRVRDSLEALRDQLNYHAAEDAGHFKEVMDRLLVIETERKGEKESAVKRATWIGLLAASATTGFWKAVEHWSR